MFSIRYWGQKFWKCKIWSSHDHLIHFLTFFLLFLSFFITWIISNSSRKFWQFLINLRNFCLSIQWVPILSDLNVIFIRQNQNAVLFYYLCYPIEQNRVRTKSSIHCSSGILPITCCRGAGRQHCHVWKISQKWMAFVYGNA